MDQRMELAKIVVLHVRAARHYMSNQSGIWIHRKRRIGEGDEKEEDEEEKD